MTRAFSGRPGRSIANAYALASAVATAPPPAPYPVQRALTALMRAEAGQMSDIERMQAWAGQSCALAREQPAGEVVRRLWDEACVRLQLGNHDACELHPAGPARSNLLDVRTGTLATSSGVV